MARLIESPVLIVFLAGVTLLAIVVPLGRMLLVYRGSVTRRPRDASSLGLVPGGRVAPFTAALAELGFVRLGEAQLDLPGQRLVQFQPTGSPTIVGPHVATHTIFLFVDHTGTILAETGEVEGAPVLVSLSTMFADGSVVETMYPRGESIDDPDFHSGHVTSSLAAAYDEQRLHVARWRMRHGTPVTISSVEDYLRGDAEYRERFALRKLRGPLVRRQLVPSAVLALAIVAVAAYWWQHWPS